MASFKSYYQAIYATFGYPLTARDALGPDVLTTAGKRLGVRVPAALRDYYAVAGRERRFNRCQNRLLPPSDWAADRGRLIFLEENQSVFWWGVSTRDAGADDPPVAQGLNAEPITWARPDHRRCSVFLAVMLPYQAVNGGFDFSGWAGGPVRRGYQFAEHGWRYYGTVRRMRAYSRPRQAVCVVPPSDVPFLRGRTVLAAAKTARELRALADDLGVVIG
jgi:hypothetical protein